MSQMKWVNGGVNGGIGARIGGPAPTRAPVQLANMFYSLNLTNEDGWVQPKFVQGKDFNEMMGKAVHAWLEKHADTYQIKRHVLEK